MLKRNVRKEKTRMFLVYLCASKGWKCLLQFYNMKFQKFPRPSSAGMPGHTNKHKFPCHRNVFLWFCIAKTCMRIYGSSSGHISLLHICVPHTHSFVFGVFLAFSSKLLPYHTYGFSSATSNGFL